MDATHNHPVEREDADRAQRYIDDLTGLLDLPGIGMGTNPVQVVDTLMDALIDLLHLDFLYVRLRNGGDSALRSQLRLSKAFETTTPPASLAEAIRQFLAEVPIVQPPKITARFSGDDLSVVPLKLGSNGELGEMVAGSRRVTFPDKSEHLALSVAASQAAVVIQGAILLDERARIAGQLERQVGERTARLAATNDELRKEIAEHIRTEDELRESKQDAQLVIDGIPALVIVSSSSGQIERVNQQAHGYFGTGLEGTTEWPSRGLIHPHDFDRTIQVFADSMASGNLCEIEHRLRRYDGASRWFQTRALPVRATDGGIAHWYVLLTDIDARKQAEDQLRARELSVRLLVESMESIPAFAIVANEAGEIVFANRQVLGYYGRTLDEVRAWPMSVHIVHPDDLEHANQVVADSLRAGVRYDDEYRLQRHDGEYRWFEGRGMPVRDRDGRVINWYVLLIDIDDRKRAERLLAAENRMLKMVASGTALPVVLHTLCGLVEELGIGSRCSIRLIDSGGATFQPGIAPSLPHGYNEATEGTSVRPEAGPCGMAAYLKTQVIAADVATETRWGDGWRAATLSNAFLSVWSSPILSRNQKVLGTFAIYRKQPGGPTALQGNLIDQFTQIASVAIERTGSDAALRRSEAFLLEAQRLSSTGGFSWDLTTDELTWSEEVYRIFEVDPAVPATLELTLTRMHPEDVPAFHEMRLRQLRQRNDFEHDYRLLMPDQSVKHLHVVAHATRDEDGHDVYNAAVQDVTQRRLSEAALGELRSELAHMARVTSLSALTASIAHEVNQPLSGIITNAGTSLRMLGADPPNIDGARETARRTIRDANRASDVINRLRALFTKKETSVELVDVNDATQDVIALSQHELDRNRVVLRTEFADSLPVVRGDRVQIQQVVLNLLLNAGDAMNVIADRTRQIEVRTELDAKGHVRLTVTDNGPGIDPLIADRLFEPFFSTKATGMGIGLSISRSIIEQHGGRLWLERKEGPGAAFALSIPPQPSTRM